MYNRDVKRIAEHAKASPQGLVDLVTFVLCTIQQPLAFCDKQIEDIKRNGADSVYLFGSKRAGYEHIIEHAGVYWSQIREYDWTPEQVVDLFTHIPGIGVAKAGFIAQCLGYDVACMDTHNLKRLGYPENFTFKFTPRTKRKVINEYVALCQQEGSQYWWDTWCEGVAGSQYNRTLGSADVVSAYHVQCVTGEVQ